MSMNYTFGDTKKLTLLLLLLVIIVEAILELLNKIIKVEIACLEFAP